MTPETILEIIKLGEIGLLAIVIYAGWQANTKMLDILATTLAKLIDMIEKLEQHIQ